MRHVWSAVAAVLFVLAAPLSAFADTGSEGAGSSSGSPHVFFQDLTPVDGMVQALTVELTAVTGTATVAVNCDSAGLASDTFTGPGTASVFWTVSQPDCGPLIEGRINCTCSWSSATWESSGGGGGGGVSRDFSGAIGSSLVADVVSDFIGNLEALLPFILVITMAVMVYKLTMKAFQDR